VRIRNNNDLDLEAPEGERLTVTIASGASVAVVTVDLPGGTGVLTAAGHRFVVPAPGAKSYCLVGVTCTFKTSGTCDVRIADESGNIAQHTFSTAFGLVSNTVVFSIDIVPAGRGAGGLT